VPAPLSVRCGAAARVLHSAVAAVAVDAASDLVLPPMLVVVSRALADLCAFACYSHPMLVLVPNHCFPKQVVRPNQVSGWMALRKSPPRLEVSFPRLVLRCKGQSPKQAACWHEGNFLVALAHCSQCYPHREAPLFHSHVEGFHPKPACHHSEEWASQQAGLFRLQHGRTTAARSNPVAVLAFHPKQGFPTALHHCLGSFPRSSGLDNCCSSRAVLPTRAAWPAR